MTSNQRLFFKKKKIYLFINIYLFIWLCWVSVAAGRLLSCGSRAPQLWHACGIQFPDQESNPGPLHWERRVLTIVPPGKSHIYIFFNINIYLFIWLYWVLVAVSVLYSWQQQKQRSGPKKKTLKPGDDRVTGVLSGSQRAIRMSFMLGELILCL